VVDDGLLATQQHRRSMALDAGEVDDLLQGARTCRVATLTSSGAPHVSPLWFVWDGDALWLHSLVRSQRWAGVLADPRAAVVVDLGEELSELRGVELRGVLEPVGPAPRDPAQPIPAETARTEQLWVAKYHGAADDGTIPAMRHDGRHAWLRLTPSKVVSWDHRKLA
jgi:hypothetical protein